MEDSRRFSSLEMKGVTGAFYHSSICFLVVCRAGVDYVLSFCLMFLKSFLVRLPLVSCILYNFLLFSEDLF